MFNFKKLISPEYLFSIDTVLLHRSDQLFLIIGISLVTVAVITFLTSRFAPNQYGRRMWQRVSNWALTIGLLEVIWFGLRYENIRVLGTHATALLILLVGLAWFIPIAKYRLIKYGSDIDGWNKEQMKQKYLQMNK